MNLLELINVNVYTTNILLFLPITFIYLIIKKIEKWKEINLVIQQFYFLCFWYGLLILFIIGTILSCIYHYYMFQNTPKIHKIAMLDVNASAPALSIICLILFILYYLYLNDPNTKNVPSIKYVTTPIFFIALGCSTIGMLSWLIKYYCIPKAHLYLLNYDNIYNSSEYDIMCGLCIHIFFHYMSYTGITLLLLLYYIEIHPIFKAFFYSYEKCRDIQKIE